jgi:hypothetical protein
MVYTVPIECMWVWDPISPQWVATNFDETQQTFLEHHMPLLDVCEGTREGLTSKGCVYCPKRNWTESASHQ